jgi:hypothetical protein
MAREDGLVGAAVEPPLELAAIRLLARIETPRERATNLRCAMVGPATKKHTRRAHELGHRFGCAMQQF